MYIKTNGELKILLSTIDIYFFYVLSYPLYFMIHFPFFISHFYSLISYFLIFYIYRYLLLTLIFLWFDFLIILIESSCDSLIHLFDCWSFHYQNLLLLIFSLSKSAIAFSAMENHVFKQSQSFPKRKNLFFRAKFFSFSVTHFVISQIQLFYKMKY